MPAPDAGGAPQRWLLLIYRVPQEPASRRAYVWRHLKQIGAVYLQHAAAIAPDRKEVRAQLEALAERIEGFQGDVSLLETVSSSARWEREVIRRFNQTRDAEYGELLEGVARFEEEVRHETRRKRFTFAELEDIDGEWERLQRWTERVLARDFFEAAGRAEALRTLERAGAAREGFTATVYAHEDVQGEQGEQADQDRPADSGPRGRHAESPRPHGGLDSDATAPCPA